MVRWTCPGAGTYDITGTFGRGDLGTVDRWVYQGGLALGSWLNGDTDVPFHYNLSLVAGATLDFIVGPAGGDSDDAVPIAVTISSGPNPGDNLPPAAVNDAYSVAQGALLSISAPGVLANDWDPDGDSLQAAVVSQPSHGALTVNANGSFTYTPAANYYGSDSFTYKANDGTADSESATVSITVTAVQAAADDLATQFSLTTNPKGNWTYGHKSTPTGSLTIFPNLDLDMGGQPGAPGWWDARIANPWQVPMVMKNMTGVPFPFSGGRSMPVNQVLIHPASSPATYCSVVRWTCPGAGMYDITGIFGKGDLGTVDRWVYQRGLALGSWLNGDTDVPFHYDLSLAAGATLDLIVGPAGGDSSDATPISVTISSASNSGPVAIADAYATNENVALTVPSPGVLANDTGVGGSSLTAAVVTQPSHGTLTLNANGSFTYTPTANYHGPDSFSYRANDGTAASQPATVAITVNAVNDRPVAQGQNANVVQNGAAAILLSGSDADGDALTYAVVTAPAHGTLSGTAPSLTYTPAANYSGPDSFTFKANDGTANSEPATVSITVTAAQAGVDDLTTQFSLAGNPNGNWTYGHKSTLAGTLTAYPDVDLASYGRDGLPHLGGYAWYDSRIPAWWKAPDVMKNMTGVPWPYGGGRSLLANQVSFHPGSVPTTYYSVVRWTCPAAGTYAITGSFGRGDVGTVDLWIYQGASMLGSWLSRDADIPFHYNLSLAAGATLDFVVGPAGADTDDGTPISVTIGAAPNNAPVAIADAYATDEDVALTAEAPGVLANDTDVEGSPLTAAIVTPPSHGALTLNANGSFTYTPAANYNGSDSFVYKANDGTANSANATVTILVSAVNDAPVAANNSYS
ncbi:MAG: Ig-like domain-containing protein, partial [Armatimonadota bacterium]